MPRKTTEAVSTTKRAKVTKTSEAAPAAPRRHKKATPVVAAPPELHIDPDHIATRAYYYWEQRGCQGGSPEEDWLRAEDELRQSAVA